MEQELGLRERKKHKTRQLIAETARMLFAERGFEAVSVAEIARAADVSQATVFNYFPTKEDLVYQGMEAFEEQLLRAVSDRPGGMGALEAFGRFALTPRGLLADDDAAGDTALVAVSRMIAASPSLLARERQILTHYADSLAAVLAEETSAGPDDLTPHVVAATLIGLHRSLIDYVRRRLAHDHVDTGQLAREVRTEGEKALRLLGQGLDGYDISQRETAAAGSAVG
jgi:AcrR family transcriptional regulator